MYRIVGMCMWCHGKVIQGKEKKTVPQCMDCGKNQYSEKVCSVKIKDR